MGLKTKTGLGFIIALGIFIAVVIFGNIITPPAPPTQEAQKATALESSAAQTLPEPTRYVNPATSNEENNATKDIASLTAKQIVDLNPHGTRDNTLRVKNAEAIAEEAFEKSMRDFDPSYFTPDIRQKDIIISKNQDPETYRAAARQIIADITNAFYSNADDPLKDRLQALAERHKKAAEKLYALTVPEALAAEHQKTIQVIITKERILEKAAGYETDENPVGLLLALKLWETIK